MSKQTNSHKTLKDENFMALNKLAIENLVVMYESDRAFIARQLKKDS